MPVTPENLEHVTAQLVAFVAAAGEKAQAHFHWILTAYLDLPDEAFDAELAKQLDRIFSSETETFLNDLVVARVSTTQIPPQISDALARLERCPKPKQVVMVQKLVSELFARQRWEQLLSETPDDFVDMLKAALD